jgi:CheY-like chemotaxis protein
LGTGRSSIAAFLSMILIVEDDREVAASLRRLLKSAGHDAVAVTTGRDAIDFLRSSRPRLVLLDFQLSDMTGLDVLRHLRGQPDLHDVPVMMHTASHHASTEREARQLGVAEFLLKGCNGSDVLLSLVEKHLRTSGGSHT